MFLSFKSRDLDRVEMLIARALRATWTRTEKGARLVPVKSTPKEDLPEFERQLHLVLAGKPYEGLGSNDLFRMTPGSILRYGATPTSVVLPIPKAMKQSGGTSTAVWRVHRLAYGIYEVASSGLEKNVGVFDKDGSVNFDSLPIPVVALLGPSAESIVPEGRTLNEVLSGKATKDTVGSSDIIAKLVTASIQGIGTVSTCDIAIAVPDASLFATISDAQSKTSRTLKNVLAKFSLADEWTVADGAAVARLTATEAADRGQVRRHVFRKYVQAAQAKSIVGMNELTAFVNDQRLIASETWVDAMMLSISNFGIADDYIGDYPYNVRLYGSLTSSDWALLQSGKAFPISALSGSAQGQVEPLLIQSRSRMEGQGSDPALWLSLAPSDLIGKATVLDEPVVVCWIPGGAQIRTPESAGMQHDSFSKSLKQELLYQPARRQKVKLVIRCSTGESVETGFSNVILKPSDAPVSWQNLPPALAAEFKKGRDRMKPVDQSRKNGTPPPQ